MKALTRTLIIALFSPLAVNALNMQQNVIDMPAKTQLVVKTPMTIQQNLSFTLLQQTDYTACYLGSVNKMPAEGKAPDFVGQPKVRPFKAGERFTVQGVTGFAKGKKFQGYVVELDHEERMGTYALYVEQTGPAAGFTSIEKLLNQCADKLAVK
ncbi:hypothetical protein [Leeia oryzae]|uniref:hypothetical protein n=1 Tax=Leeia oryzae TaxID=356662 RepID=UPI00037F7DF6|nr:hypothetical protein [Leeia oryzae]